VLYRLDKNNTAQARENLSIYYTDCRIIPMEAVRSAVRRLDRRISEMQGANRGRSWAITHDRGGGCKISPTVERAAVGEGKKRYVQKLIPNYIVDHRFVERDRTRLLSQISCIKYEEEHRRMLKMPHLQPGKWLFESVPFKNWIETSESAVLCCFGIRTFSTSNVACNHTVTFADIIFEIAGSGKTILT